MTSDHQKPSRDDLLTELESIRESLLPEELQKTSVTEASSHKQDSPASNTTEAETFEADIETAAGESEPSAREKEPSAIEKEPSALEKEPSALESEPSALEIVPSATESPEQNNEEPIENNDKERPMHVLPGQQSLFDEEKKNAAAEAARARDAAQVPANEPEAKENPFLPRHIKQKLEKERSLYQNQVDDYNASSHTRNASSQGVLSKENETLIDELVAEYLPKIEEVLKQRLREKINRDSEAS